MVVAKREREGGKGMDGGGGGGYKARVRCPPLSLLSRYVYGTYTSTQRANERLLLPAVRLRSRPKQQQQQQQQRPK